MYLLIIFLPLLGSFTAGLLGRLVGTKGSILVSTSLVIASFIMSMMGFYEVIIGNMTVTIDMSRWVTLSWLSGNWSFNFDSLTISRLIPVLSVSSVVHIYSRSYRSNDPHVQRFFSYLSRFTFFMVLLVTGDNYLMMFLGWEGIGVASFLLISFWYTRLETGKAAVQALLVNRVGDRFLSIGIFLLMWNYGSSYYSTVELDDNHCVLIVGLMFVLAAMGKSAQLGLHVWLPSAREGPTPVSALIHAATLVTAGVYLLLRSSTIIESTSMVSLMVLWVGAITSIFAATVGRVQNDLKRVIAYSTCSQRGYLFMAIGLSQYSIALYHLVNHAFFKAVLFLSAGSVLHAMKDQQDLRRLGGLINLLPATYTILLIGSLSLIAFPWLSGFYSKDRILESGIASYSSYGSVVYYVGLLTAMITSYYSFRLIDLVFFNTPQANKSSYDNIHLDNYVTVLGQSFLAILSISFGFIAKDLFIGVGSDAYASSLFINSTNIIDMEFSLPNWSKMLPLVSLLAIFVKVPLYKPVYNFLIKKWLFDIMVVKMAIKLPLDLGIIINNDIDMGLLETMGPKGISNLIINKK